jgi:hypothetical protein
LLGYSISGAESSDVVRLLVVITQVVHIENRLKHTENSVELLGLVDITVELWSMKYSRNKGPRSVELVNVMTTMQLPEDGNR